MSGEQISVERSVKTSQDIIVDKSEKTSGISNRVNINNLMSKVRDEEKVIVHANKEKTIAGSRHYIHAEDVAEALLFLYNYDISQIESDDTSAKCQKFNIVGKDEIDNLELAQFIAKVQRKELKYQMVDFHSSRPGHDLRYALDGSKMKKMGWEPESAFKRLESVVKWTLDNNRWLNT